MSELEVKKVVMAVGSTGVGKSTIMNALIQGSENIFSDEEFNINARKELIYKGIPVFQIGHHCQSCTKSPGFYLHNDIYFLDCPGVTD